MAERTLRTARGLVAGAAVLGLGLAGCGGSSGGSEASSSSSATTAGTSASSSSVKPTSVAIIGDSLTYQNGNGQTDVTASLEKQGWPAKGICWSGVDGRTIVDSLPGGAPSAQQVVKQCRKQLGGEPQLWVIALISNNLGDTPAQVRKDMSTLLSVLGPQAHILWVNAGRSDLTTQNILTLNPVVASTLKGRAHTTIADWFGYLKAHPDQKGWWQADGTHMTRAGYAHRNTFVAEQARAALSS